MDETTKVNAKGRAKQVKGTIKEKAGRATGNRRMEASGQADRGKGKVESGLGRSGAKVKQLVRKAVGKD
jgi:uncharacterized protein YjbJ (UPF0337 family)